MESESKVFDIKIRAYNYVLKVVKVLKKTKSDTISIVLIKQLVRSSTSIGANIVEGKYSGTEKEYVRYLEIAMKSSNESIYWICLLRDTEYLDKKIANDLVEENQQISKILSSIILKLRKK
jgi:four helix bundle protein